MNKLLLSFLVIVSSCTTIHFRSNNSVPVSFDGNPKHQREVSIVGQKNFYFWGTDPEHHEVFIDEEVRAAGYDGISKLIIYEHKNPQDMLISFLTFGLYMPRGYTITGYSSAHNLPETLDEESAPKK